MINTLNILFICICLNFFAKLFIYTVRDIYISVFKVISVSKIAVAKRFNKLMFLSVFILVNL